MSGHNKWSQIKRQKGASDAKKSQAFSKMSKNISLAAKKGEDPAGNFELKTAIERAREVNMPQDSIDKAIKKGSGKLEGGLQLETVRFEAYGPGGTAIIIEGITDNRNRTVAEIKHLINKKGAKWAESGSVLWAFELKDGKWEPKHTVEISEKDGETLGSLLEELDDHDDVQEIYTNAL